MSFISLGLCAFLYYQRSKKWQWLALCGALHAVAVLGRTAIAPGMLVLGLGLLFSQDSSRFRRLMTYCVPFTLVWLIIWISWSWPDFSSVLKSVRYMQSLGAGTSTGLGQKLVTSGTMLIRDLASIHTPTTGSSLHIIAAASALSILVWRWVPTVQRQETWLAYTSALVAGLSVSLTSTNGLNNFAIGAATMPLIAAMAMGVKKPRIVFVSVILYNLLLLTTLQTTYRSAKLPLLNKTASQGAWRGISAHPDKLDFALKLQEDIQVCHQDHPKIRTVFFFDRFPAGYLLTRLKPNTPTLWTFPPSRRPAVGRDYLMDYFEGASQWPDLIVQLHKIYHSPDRIEELPYEASDPFVERVKANYSPLVQRPAYVIYGRNDLIK